ncbi:glycosyltransferase family 4 protein [Photobacterium phosphoreum]|uniref:glycosyltransferase family 4 protein n=1 Tax=Photobacterium phosphoreum TaxID=659 RepID=UPI000D1A9EB4|nr:glycosyltransferase family 4 protein [Photobacterium phosphoreum]PSW09952.1 glycosyltransferase family 4 protein [Photobacterium phosphoreum]
MDKIAIVINDISKSGGTERVAVFLSNSLSAFYNITLISIENNGKSYYPLDDNVKLIYCESESKFKLAKFLNKSKFDKIIPISMGRLSFYLSCFLFFLRSKSELVLSEHVGFEVGNPLIKMMKLLGYSLADKVVVLTEYDKKKIEKFGIKSIYKVPNASSFLPLKVINEDSKYILSIGRLTYQKNFERLLKIWSEVENKNGWKLKIIGDGEDINILNSLINKYRIEDSTLIKPARKDIECEYLDARIFVMTSRYEGLPLVLIESKSFGLAAIAFDCVTGPIEIIENNKDGYVISYEDNYEFKNKLCELISDKCKLEKLQKQALMNSTHYSQEKIVKIWLDCLRGKK